MHVFLLLSVVIVTIPNRNGLLLFEIESEFV